jgi:hypothetical protein
MALNLAYSEEWIRRGCERARAAGVSTELIEEIRRSFESKRERLARGLPTCRLVEREI